MKHGHYRKNVSHLLSVDIYRVLSLFGVTDQAIGHAIKKLLCPGERGSKTKREDIQEAIDSLERWKEMEGEDFLSVVKQSLTDDPASEIDDDSPRMHAIVQNGNDGSHYGIIPVGSCLGCRSLSDACDGSCEVAP